MKFPKKNYLLIVIMIVVLTLPRGLAQAMFGSQVLPQTATMTPSLPQSVTSPQAEFSTEIPDTEEWLTFDDFGFEEIALQGPFAAYGYYFDLPSTWQMKVGAELHLVLDTFYTGIDPNIQNFSPSTYGGTLFVQYNYITVAAIDLNQEGLRQVVIPISYEVLTRLGGNQGQAIQIILDSGINCDVNFKTTVVVRSVSQLYFPHDLVSPSVDLTRLPIPFSQNSFSQTSTVIVTPDQPSADELQAALSVSAGLGRMTFNRLEFSMVPIGQLTAGLTKNNNIIFVGKADGFALLRNIPLPAPLTDEGFTLGGGDTPTDDGVIQMAVSPWSESNVILVVGGNEDKAVVNAARAFSTGEIRVGNNPSLALVSNVQPFVSPVDATTVNKTLEALGYDSIVVSEVGLNRISYNFDLPVNYILGPDAYLDLVLSYTSLLEYDRSSIVVRLNDEPVGSVRLTEDTAGQVRERINLPPSAVRPGNNRLQLDINLEPRNICVNPLLNGLWMRIDNASIMNLSFIPDPTGTSNLIDLGKYPSQFVFNPIMDNLAFVLAENDPTGWDVAAHLAFSLGYINTITLAGFEAYYGDAVPDEIRQGKNLIIVGKPSTLKILEDLYEVLPAPFESGTDLAIEEGLQVSYELGTGVDIGYLELLPAPWNPKNTILYVGGSSDQGVKWSGSALLLGRLKSQLQGDLAFINNEQVVNAGARIPSGSQSVLPSAVISTPLPSAPMSAGERPNWILPMILVALSGMVLVMIILAVQVLIRRHPKK